LNRGVNHSGNVPVMFATRSASGPTNRKHPAPPQPELFGAVSAMRGSVAPASSAAFPPREWPVIAIFFFAQRYFLRGVTLTGMKG